MRNSSLVEGSCAENVTGLKSAAEAVDVQVQGGKFDSGRSNQWPNSVRGRKLAEQPEGIEPDVLITTWTW